MAASLLISLLVLLSLCWTPEGMLLGGQMPIQKLDDPEVMKAVSFAVEALNKDTAGDNLIVLVSVEKGTMQVYFKQRQFINIAHSMSDKQFNMTIIIISISRM